MIAWLTNASKKRVIGLIRGFLRDHPRYRGDADSVQNKFAFSERPSRGVIVNGVSGDRVKLAPDNYVGRLSSFVMQAPYNSKPNTTVEWVRENFNVLERVDPLRRHFPTSPGAYLFKVTALPDEPKKLPGKFDMTPIVEVMDEPLIHFLDSGLAEGNLLNTNIYPGSVRLYIGKVMLVDGVDFQVDINSGAIYFQKVGPVDQDIYADYLYFQDVKRDIPFYKEQANVDVIPGAVIAFGDRPQMDDEWAIVVTDNRTETNEIYGGKFELNFEIVVFCKDAEDREKMSDYIVMKTLEAQNSLAQSGFELLEVNPGGENEDVFNPETDEYFYESNISMSFRVDWSIYVPLPVKLMRIVATSKALESEAGYLDGTARLDLIDVRMSSPTMSVGNQLTYEYVK